jgi:hypothetical protein
MLYNEFDYDTDNDNDNDRRLSWNICTEALERAAMESVGWAIARLRACEILG